MQGLIITETDIRIATDADLMHATLERLLFLELGTMLNSLSNGSRILDYLDEPAVEQVAIGIIQEAADLIQNREPRIVLDAVGADVVPDGGAVGVVVYLEWHFVDETRDQSYTSLVQKIFVIS